MAFDGRHDAVAGLYKNGEQLPEDELGTLTPIKLLLAGPRMTEARALHELLAEQQAAVVVGETLEVSRVAELVRSQRPDVVLLHVRGPEFALEAVRTILAQVPDAKLLMIVESFGLDQAELLLEHGAHGILAVNDSHAQGIRAIRTVHSGEIWASRPLLSRIVRTSVKQTILVHTLSKSSLTLTERERQIVTLLRSGLSNKEIAAHLTISDKTVKTHLRNIFGKLNINRRQKILPALR